MEPTRPPGLRKGAGAKRRRSLKEQIKLLDRLLMNLDITPEEYLARSASVREALTLDLFVRLTDILLGVAEDNLSYGKAREILRTENFPTEVWQMVLPPPQS